MWTKQMKKENNKFSLSGRVVVDLTKHLEGKYHKVYFNNFLSSVPLCEYLCRNGILAFGTITSSQKCLPVPELLTDMEMNRGDYDYRSTSSGIAIFKWMDTKPVYFISNFHGVQETTVKRNQKDSFYVFVTCPSLVKDYNAFIFGVDKHDQMRQLYGHDRKSVKWRHRLFFEFVDVTVVNSFVYIKRLMLVIYIFF